MLRVGLTGSIAVGKSVVLARFAALGCHTSDADHIARRVVEPGTTGLERLVTEFGRDILDPENRLDRAALGAIIFRDALRREQLNRILHPLIIEEQNRWLDDCEARDFASIAVIEAALMIESGGYRRFDKIVVVHCEKERQVERLMKRNALTRDEAERRIAAQMPQVEKMSYANYLIDTSHDTAQTVEQTDGVYKAMLKDSANSGR
jgi:dephospho-CoA kinase